MIHYKITLIDGDNAGYNIVQPPRTFLKLNVDLEYENAGFRGDFELTIDWPEDEQGNTIGTTISAGALSFTNIAHVLEYLDDRFMETGADYYEDLFHADGDVPVMLYFSK